MHTKQKIYKTICMYVCDLKIKCVALSVCVTINIMIVNT